MRLGDFPKIFGAVSGTYFTLKNGVRVYPLTVATTANTTVTTAPAGSLGFTSHATGRGILFYSDGSKWQNAGGGGDSVTRETPTGAVNGVNRVFTFVGNPVSFIRNGVDEFRFGVAVGNVFTTGTGIAIPETGDDIEGLTV